MTARMEQLDSTHAAAAPAQQFDVAPSNTELKNANANATDRAQGTVDQRFGTPEIQNSSDVQNPGTKTDSERPLLDPNQLMQAAETGRLGDELSRQGVDINDDKAVQSYMEKSYDQYIEKGLRLSGVNLPADPTAEDLGKALIDKVQGAQNYDLKKSLEANPAEGYKSMRAVYINEQNRVLNSEKLRRGR